MDKKEQEFLQRLRETFRLEADEHLRAMSAGVLRLEQGLSPAEQATTVELVFREAHSLKGAARAVNLLDMESVCQALESVFAGLKRSEIRPSAALYDRVHAALALLGTLLANVRVERDPAEKLQVVKMARELAAILHEQPAAPSPQAAAQLPRQAAAALPEDDSPVSAPQSSQNTLAAPPESAPRPPGPASAAGPSVSRDTLPLPETVRIPTAKLNAVLLQAEEMLSAKLALAQRVAELREAGALLTSWERERNKIQVELRTLLRRLEKNTPRDHQLERRKADEPVSKVALFAQATGQTMKLLEAKLAALGKSAEQDRRAFSGMVDRLLDDTRKALMLPFTAFLEAIPMQVRDLARDQGKEVSLVIHGGETEVDRRILEEMKDPLLHLIRNCIDHGIEKPAERVRRKKPTHATITIAISQLPGGKLEIITADDGSGINFDQVRASALKSGAITAQEAAKMDDAAVASLIFRSGVSSSPLITAISGRGLGLAIVREKVDKLGGTLTVETRANAGTTFRITLPLTLAAFRGVLVRVGEQLLIVPSAQVLCTLRLSKDQIKSAENRDAIQHDSRVVSLVCLGDALGMPRQAAPAAAHKYVYVLVLTTADQRIAFSVDEILEEQEVLVKSLGQQLPPVRNIAGAAVLGTGKVVPVLNASDLMQSALNVRTAPAAEAEAHAPPAPRRRLLVAEDSITTRTLLKNILETAGYTVKTAVDGVDALTSLRAEDFDLVVSDIDMPRLNGFGLTSAIRTDKRLAELPVVLVTALDSREDRERGIDVGASAYLVKSSFEQSNLLEVVRRLI